MFHTNQSIEQDPLITDGAKIVRMGGIGTVVLGTVGVASNGAALVLEAANGLAMNQSLIHTGESSVAVIGGVAIATWVANKYDQFSLRLLAGTESEPEPSEVSAHCDNTYSCNNLHSFKPPASNEPS
ncbi:MAG: hypothetical protein WC498_01860 [Candidatus Saccharimonadales bacterium]